MTWYRECEPLQEPFDFGLDSTGRRSRFAFNVRAVRNWSTEFEDELKGEIVASGVLTSGQIFIGSKAHIPDGDGPYMTIRATSGGPPEREHNQIHPPAYVNSTAQVIALHVDPVQAELKAYGAFGALNFRNKEVT